MSSWRHFQKVKLKTLRFHEDLITVGFQISDYLEQFRLSFPREAAKIQAVVQAVKAQHLRPISLRLSITRTTQRSTSIDSSSFSSNWATNRDFFIQDLRNFHKAVLEYQTFLSSKRDIVISESHFTSHTSKSLVSQTDERFRNFENLLNSSIKQSIFISVRSKSISVFSASFLTTEAIESRETSAEKIIFDMTESEDNNDEESSDNIENLDFAVTTVITAVVNAAVNVAMQNLSVESQDSEDSQDSSDDENQDSRWNVVDVEFFDLFYDEKFATIEDLIVHFEKNTYFRNVHVFIDRVKDMTLMKRFDVIRNNLFTCLRETALNWYHAKLSDEDKRILKYETEVEKWITALLKRFKENSSTTMIVIIKERYFLKNARRHRESREYAQIILRAVKSAMMIFVYNQLFLVYNELDVKFQQHLIFSTFETTIDSFLDQLDMKREIWWALTNRHRMNDQSHSKEKSSYRYEDNRSNNRSTNESDQSQYFNRQDFFKSSFSSTFSFFSSYDNYNNQNRTYQQNQQYSISSSYENQSSNAKTLMSSSQKQITDDSANAFDLQNLN